MSVFAEEDAPLTSEQVKLRIWAINLLISGKEGIETWNKWREDNPTAELPILNEAPLCDGRHAGDFQGANLSNLKLRSAGLTSALLNNANLKGADLAGAQLQRAEIQNADLRHASFIGAKLTHACLNYSDLRGAHLDDARIDHAFIYDADIRRVILEGPERGTDSYENGSLRGATFKHTNLGGAKLCGADLRRCRFDNSTLSETDLRLADLFSAKLCGANLNRADLRKANLGMSHLVGASLVCARVSGANLRDADFSEAKVGGIIYRRRSIRFQGINVSSCTGNPLFKRDAQDEDWIESFRSRSLWHRFLHALWWLFSDCGRSLIRVGFFGGSLSAFFGWIFASNPELLDVGDSANTWWTPYYYSIVTFTTLGFGDVTPKSLEGEFWVCAEVILGYLTLGLIVSILANKVARRS